MEAALALDPIIVQATQPEPIETYVAEIAPGVFAKVRRFSEKASTCTAGALGVKPLLGFSFARSGIRLVSNGETSPRREWKGRCLLHFDHAHVAESREKDGSGSDSAKKRERLRELTPLDAIMAEKEALLSEGEG